MKNITTAQLRAARALLRWSAEDLATAAGVSLVTIRRAEPKDGPLAMIPANAAAVRRALETAGVIFVPENGEGAGVRLRKHASSANGG
jgi:transcriptional regulator with XRE-family HTH domain